MLKKFWYFTSVCALNLINIPSWAADWQWIPSASFNYRDLSYSAGLTDVSATILSLGTGITLTRDRWYMDGSFETDVSSESDNPGLAFERKDLTVSVGYGLSDTLSTFAGYKYGRTRIGLTDIAGEPIQLTGKGFFIGAGAGLPIKQHGVLFFSAAYARLESLYQDSSVADASGNAAGTSLSLGWRGRITEHWNYETTLVRHDYYHQNFTGISLDINENILSFNAKLSYQF